MPVPASYHGREQAFVKHRLLETYLQRLFMIIGLNQSSIRYVDCFSGPWQEDSADLSDTSIGIVLNIIRKSREGLTARGREVSFHALFIEKDKIAFKKLQAHLSDFQQPGISTSAFHGDFFELPDSMLNWCGPDFTFFFVDPKGWKNVVEIPTLTPLLQRPNSEFLINFMYDFLSRTHPQESFREDMLAIFGEVRETGGLSPEQREVYLIDLYKQRLKKILPAWGGKPRVVSVPVLYPTVDRTLYHLVYLTRHPKGITVFMKASDQLDLIQRRAREDAKHREFGSWQRNMFTASSLISKERRAAVIEVKSYWLKRLSSTPSRFGIEELAEMIEETGRFESDFQVAFHELEKEGRVKNLDATGKRRTTFVNFTAQGNKGERLVREK